MPETLKNEAIRISVDVPKALHMQFRIICVQRDENMKDVMLNLLTNYIKKADNPHSE